jgi:hypothetical protein
MSEPRQRGPRALPLALLAALVLAAIMAGGLNANLVARSGAAAGGPEQVCNVIVKVRRAGSTGAVTWWLLAVAGRPALFICVIDTLHRWCRPGHHRRHPWTLKGQWSAPAAPSAGCGP